MSLNELEIKFTLEVNNDIKSICKPLERLGISFFGYIKTFPDGSRIDINTSPELSEFYYIKSKEYLNNVIENNPKIESGFVLWDYFEYTNCTQYVRESMNIDHGITLIENNMNSCEFWHFASTRENSKIISYYLNNLDSLKLFTLYFKDKAQNLIIKAEKNKIIIMPTDKILVPRERTVPDIKSITRFKEHLLSSSADFDSTCHVDDNYLKQLLSQRELETLFYVLQGKTAKEVARILNLSFRTVEGYIDNIKIKYNCRTKSELFAQANKNDLLNKLPSILLSSNHRIKVK